jgi:hypothetical protein
MSLAAEQHSETWLQLSEATALIDHDHQKARQRLERAVTKAWLVPPPGLPLVQSQAEGAREASSGKQDVASCHGKRVDGIISHATTAYKTTARDRLYLNAARRGVSVKGAVAR